VISNSARGSVNVSDRISSRTHYGIVGGYPRAAIPPTLAKPPSGSDRHRITVGSQHPNRSVISTPGSKVGVTFI